MGLSLVYKIDIMNKAANLTRYAIKSIKGVGAGGELSLYDADGEWGSFVW